MSDWKYITDKEYPHLNRWQCKIQGISLSVRYVRGCDYNVKQEKENNPKRLYSCHIGFPNSRPDLIPVDHSIGIDLYRDSVDECKTWMEITVLDFISTIKGESNHA